jgi:hypothetical protein
MLPHSYVLRLLYPLVMLCFIRLVHLLDRHVTFSFRRMFTHATHRQDEPVIRSSPSRGQVFRNWPRLVIRTLHCQLILGREPSSPTYISLLTAAPPCASKRPRTSNSRLLPLDFVGDSRAERNRALSPHKASIPALSPSSTLCERTKC